MDEDAQPVGAVVPLASENEKKSPTRTDGSPPEKDNKPSVFGKRRNFRDASQSWDAEGNTAPSPLRSTTASKLSDVHEAFIKKYRFASDTTDDFVHENPWKAITMAALAGAIIGMLISR